MWKKPPVPPPRIPVVVCLAAMALAALPMHLRAIGSDPLVKEKGFDPTGTLTEAEPISMGGTEYRQSWRLLDLGGPLDLAFTLIYAPDLRMKDPFWDGRRQFPPSNAIRSFTSDAILKIVLFEDRSATPYRAYANVFLAHDTLVFEREASGAYRALGGKPFELKQQGETYCLKDPYRQRVFFFRSRPMGVQVWLYWIDRVGEVQEVQDRNGNALTFSYNGDYLPTRIEDGLGRRLDFAYADSDDIALRHLLSVSDQAGRTVSFQYGLCQSGSSYRMESFTDALGGVTAFDYFPSPNLGDCAFIQKIHRPEGNSWVDQDWAMGPWFVATIQRQRDAYGNETSLAWTQSGGVCTVAATQPGGGQTVFHHQDLRHPLDLTDAGGQKVSFGADASWRPTSLTDREGDASAFAYDAASGFPNESTDAAGNAWTATYEARDQSFTLPSSREEVVFTFHLPTCVAGPGGLCRQIAYDNRGNALSHKDPAGRTWTATYDGGGRVLTESGPGGALATFAYHPDGTLATMDDADTEPSAFAYDGRGYLKQISYQDGSALQFGRDLLGQVTSFADEEERTWAYRRDANGNLDRLTDPASASAAFEQDLMDRTLRATDRTSRTWTRTYDALGRLASVVDPTGVAMLFGYDPRGRLTSLTNGGSTWTLAYDDEGVLTSRTSPNGLTTAYATDEMGRPVSVTLPDARGTAFERDGFGRVTKVTDPLGRNWDYTYDPTGFLTSATHPGGIAATYGYDGAGNLESITDPGGSEWRLGRTPMGRPDFQTDPLGRGWEFAYNGRGLRSGETYPGGTNLVISRDLSGRQTRRTYTGGPDLHYTYDEAGRLATTEGLAFERDAEGRITSSNDGQFALGATYDAAGRLASLDYGPFTVAYAYDPVTGLPASVSDGLTRASVTFTWDPDGRLTGIHRPNGVNTTLTWDAASRLERVRHGDLLELAYSRDAAGQVTGVATQGGIDPADHLAVSSRAYTYDAASQPIGAGFATDARGRTILLEGREFTWDSATRLLTWGGNTYEYNGASQPVRRTAEPVDRRLCFQHALPRSPLVLEADWTSGEAIRYFLYDPLGNLLYGIDAATGAPFFFHFDAQGSTLLLTDALGQATDYYSYDPYGLVLAHQGPADQPFTFQGQIQVRRVDAERLYRTALRIYDAATARFLTRELVWPHLREPRSLNPYQFAFANPLTFADPSGTDPEDATGGCATFLPCLSTTSASSAGELLSTASWHTATGETSPSASILPNNSWGGPNRDALYGGIGDDALRGPGDIDLWHGGVPHDGLNGWQGQDPLATGTDLLQGGRGNDFLAGGPGPLEDIIPPREYHEAWSELPPEVRMMDFGSERAARRGLFYMHRFLDDSPASIPARKAAGKVQGVWISAPMYGGLRVFIPGAKVRSIGPYRDPLGGDREITQEVWDPKTNRWEPLLQHVPQSAHEGLGPAEGFHVGGYPR